tara:strand:- start:321 stop:596 length:276 start_codon:yes stop_codon:yes gene_type:complete
VLVVLVALVATRHQPLCAAATPVHLVLPPQVEGEVLLRDPVVPQQRMVVLVEVEVMEWVVLLVEINYTDRVTMVVVDLNLYKVVVVVVLVR